MAWCCTYLVPAAAIAFTEDADVVYTRMATGDEAANIKVLVIEGEAVEEGDESEPEETIKYEGINGEIVDESKEKQN